MILIQRIISFGIGALAGVVVVVGLIFLAFFSLAVDVPGSEEGDHPLAMLIGTLAVGFSPFIVLAGGIIAVVVHHKKCVSRDDSPGPTTENPLDPSDPWAKGR